MSGFLHRIAVQAMGGENTLRSVARLPYTILSSPVHNEEADGQVVSWGAKANKRHPIIANNDAEWDHIFSQPQSPDRFHAEINAHDCKNEVMPSSPEVLIAQPAAGLTTKTSPEIASPSSAKSALGPWKISEKKMASDESLDGDEIIKTHNPLNNSVTNTITNEEPYSTLIDSTTPLPLLPLKNTAFPPPFNSQAQRGEPRGSTRQSQVEESTEVHVSIGRIEVIAMHEAPPLKRQAPATATAKPMTLGEYLARRRR